MQWVSKSTTHLMIGSTFYNARGAIAHYALHDFFVKHPLLEEPWKYRFKLYPDKNQVGNLSCSATINSKIEEIKDYFSETARLEKEVANEKKERNSAHLLLIR